MYDNLKDFFFLSMSKGALFLATLSFEGLICLICGCITYKIIWRSIIKASF